MTDFPSFPVGDGEQIVYVRDLKTADLPPAVRAHAGGQDRVYAIHAESGEVLALVSDWKQAFILARRHEMTPHSVH